MMPSAISACRSHPSTVLTSHQMTYTVNANGSTVTKPLMVSVKILRMGLSSHDRPNMVTTHNDATFQHRNRPRHAGRRTHGIGSDHSVGRVRKIAARGRGHGSFIAPRTFWAQARR